MEMEHPRGPSWTELHRVVHGFCSNPREGLGLRVTRSGGWQMWSQCGALPLWGLAPRGSGGWQ